MTPQASAAPVDFDHNDPAVPGDTVREQYRTMTSQCPVAHVDKHGGFEIVSGYREAREAAGEADTFISGDGVFVPESGAPRVPPLEFDGAEHLQWRALMADLLTPDKMRLLGPMVTDIVNERIDLFANAGRVDLAQSFAEPIPAIVVGRLVGLTTEESLVNRDLATVAFASTGTADFPSAMGCFVEYTLARLHERRDRPKEDFLSSLASGHYKGMDIDDGAAVQIFLALLVGGHHSTASAISGLVAHVLSSGQVKDKLSTDSKLLTRVIEESLRLTTPLP
ncbi:MAG: hypothetical protein U5O16_23925 [Rhodococcus sp. (in: high G+C Gram-positive bacteria)]|uniref:cytochrome P450 n=1 Tax=Rhodococcus sp. TaxID=1831 RepID=UPI002ADB1FC3|nr:hypothetical protein [Rhodococcus sp. (in: high G+C Gram-positive bacteria)]